MKLSKSIFIGIISTTLVTVLITSLIIVSIMYNSFTKDTQEQVREQAIYISEIQNQLSDKLDLSIISNIGENRITMIDSDGTVTYDSDISASKMENHSQRPEVVSALETGTGESIRNSDTFGQEHYYYAIKLNNGNILRISYEKSTIYALVLKAMTPISIIIMILLVIAMLVAGLLTNKIVNPVNRLNIAEPLTTNTYDELSPLLTKIDNQNRELRKQIKTIDKNKRKNEFITQNIHDGLITIDRNGNIISANSASEEIFNFKLSDGVQNYLTVCRNLNYNNSIEMALSGKPSDTTIERNGRIYRISASPVTKNYSETEIDKKKNVNSVFLFVHDITERELAEKMRREFSANVSHELKTPLTSIMGCSEIMKNGIAKQEDAPRFLEQINSESKRLLALIDDIIRLSSLDEGSSGLEMIPVDLDSICTEVITLLESKALNKNINFDYIGEPKTIIGNPRLLHEMIFNLCDNAIIYNNIGGKIWVTVGNTLEDKPFISVKDNGMGIDKDEQSRVFERFYRIDKSHSKSTGGTGLGLSIVKHVSAIHKGELIIKSEPENGTEIKVIFN